MKIYNDNSIVNLSNSIIGHFGVPKFHNGIDIIEEKLKGYKKVVIVLFDGMGQNIVRKHLKDNSFIREHYLTTINSTFPPTTAAAISSLLTGKYPIETGWISWSQYIKEYDCNVVMFRSKNHNTGELLIKDGEQHIAERLFPKTSIFELIEKYNSEVKTFCIQHYPIQKEGPKSLRKGQRMVSKVLKENENCFIYFYWDYPDKVMHEAGTNSIRTRHQVRKANAFIKRLVNKNKDTAFLLLADHGHIDIKTLNICEHPDLYDLLLRPMTLEKRSSSFFIKPGKNVIFEQLFNEYYGKYFELISKEEALKIKLYGLGEPAKGVLDTFGEYIAIAKQEYTLTADETFSRHHKIKSHHGGGTIEERLIDISVFTD